MRVRHESQKAPSATFLIVMNRRLAPVFRAFLFHIGEVLVEHEPVLARERYEALAACAADEGEMGFAGELYAPGGETRSRHQDRNAHANGFDHHLGGEPPGGAENLVVRRD